MREIAIAVGCVIGFFALLAAAGRFSGETSAAVDYQVQLSQVKAEAAGARAEAQTLRAELEKCRADLKEARGAAEALKKRVADLEKQAGKKPR